MWLRKLRVELPTLNLNINSNKIDAKGLDLWTSQNRRPHVTMALRSRELIVECYQPALIHLPVDRSSSIAYLATTPKGTRTVIKRMKNGDPECLDTLRYEFRLLRSPKRDL